MHENPSSLRRVIRTELDGNRDGREDWRRPRVKKGTKVWVLDIIRELALAASQYFVSDEPFKTPTICRGTVGSVDVRPTHEVRHAWRLALRQFPQRCMHAV